MYKHNNPSAEGLSTPPPDDQPRSQPEQIQQAVDSLKDQPGAMLPILHAIQDRFGYIPDDAVPIIAESLRHTRAEVHGIISFYHHFRTRPSGRRVIQVCRAEACQAVGARALEAHAKASLGWTSTRPARTTNSPWNRCTAWATAPAARPSGWVTTCTAG